MDKDLEAVIIISLSFVAALVLVALFLLFGEMFG